MINLTQVLGCVLICIGMLASTSFAESTSEEDFASEDVDGEEFGGFDDLDDVTLKPSAPLKSSPLSINGFARTQWAMWTLRPIEDSWAKGRQNLDLKATYKKSDWVLTLEGHLEYDLLYLTEGPFDPVQKEEYQARYIGGTQSVSKRFSLGEGSLSISTGRQIVTWGELDGISALDVINPQDQREPGVAEIDDLRIAVWLSRIQYTRASHSLEFMVRHEGNYGLLVPPQADYSPFNTIIASQPLVATLLGGKELRFAHEREGVGADTQSYFARYRYYGSGFDLGVYAASLLDGRGVLNGPKLLTSFMTALGATGSGPIEITYAHPRYSIVGTTFAKPWGNWLLKGELVSAINQPTNTGDNEDLSSLEIEEVDTLTGGLSLTYSGISDTVIAAEYQRSTLLSEDPDQPFFFPPNIDILAIRANSTFFRERITVSGVISLIAPQWSQPSAAHRPERGGLLRFDASYRLLDSLKLALGYIHYLSGDDFGPFYGLEDHDRVFTQLRWDFNVY
jgi:hypothetical protein